MLHLSTTYDITPFAKNSNIFNSTWTISLIISFGYEYYVSQSSNPSYYSVNLSVFFLASQVKAVYFGGTVRNKKFTRLRALGYYL